MASYELHPFIKFYIHAETEYIMCSIEKEEDEMQEHGIRNVGLALIKLFEGYENLVKAVKGVLERRS